MSTEQKPDNDMEFFISGLIIAGSAVVVGSIIYFVLSSSPWVAGLALFSLFAAKFINDHRPK